MKTTRKILLALVLTLVVAAVMSVCAFAFDIDTDLPKGVTNTDEQWIDSGYTDVDTEDGWYLMGTGTMDYSATESSFSTFAHVANARFYWNKTTNEAVWLIVNNNMSGNSGEEAVVSAKNLTTTNQSKFYAYASCFVDVTNTADNAIAKAFAGGAAEASQYVTQKAALYPIYERYITAGKASKQWSNVYVTAAAYASYVEYKASLGYGETESVTATADQDKLVEWAYTNIAPYKNLRNCLENGASYTLAWVFTQLANNDLPFASVEFRADKGITPYFGTVGLVLRTLEAETILFDSKITRISFTNTYRGLFYTVSSLKTFDHVTFNEDGTYAEAVTEGVVDLSGFSTATAYTVSGATYYVSQLLYGSGAESVVWFGSIKDGDTEYAGVIDTQSLQNSKSLVEFVVPASVTLELIKANAFNGCTALKTIDIKGSVAADMKIENANAFTGVSGLTIKVYSDLDKINMETALAAVGVSATVVTTKVEDSDDSEGVSIPSVITADGFMLRTSSYNGLRALFSFDEAKAENIAAETGYALVEYGAIAASAANYELAGSAEKLLAVADGTKIQRIVIFADDGTGLNKYVDVDAKQYCIAVRDFEGANTLKDIYVAGYAMWSNGTDTVITSSEYTTKTGKNTISLYTLTLEMYKAGAVNAQNTDDICLWNVLKNGAFAVTEDDTKAPSELLTLKQGYEYDADGKFTYVDLPLRAWDMYKKNNAVQWNSVGVKVEDTATTGVLWSVLVDGDSLVVVYRADPAAETSVLPQLSDSYGASAPYSTYYFTPKSVTEDPTANGMLKTATIYSPIFTAENAAKIKTLVVDYGVDTFGSGSFDDSKKSNAIATIVYPEGMTAGKYLLYGCTALRNFIYATADKSYLDAYEVDSLVDLSGLGKVTDYGVVYNAAAIENILLPTADKFTNNQQYGFYGAKSLTRVWTVGFDMPAAGTMDLSNTAIKTICKGYFNSLDNIDDIIMPECFTAISAYSMATSNQTTDSARWNVFGNNSSETKLNIHVFNWDALNVIANTFYEARQSIEYNDNKEGDPNKIAHIVDYLQITYGDETKTVLEWRADFPAKPAE